MDPLSIGIGLLTLLVGGMGTYIAHRQLKIMRNEKKQKELNSSNENIITSVIIPSKKLNSTQIIEDVNLKSYFDWLKEETGYIDIRGIKIGQTMPKSALRLNILESYTDLKIQQGLNNWELEDSNFLSNDSISLINVIQNTRSIAILGDPGSGKTTFIKYITRKLLESGITVIPFIIDLPEFIQFCNQKRNLQDKIASEELLGKLFDFLVELNKNGEFNFSQSWLSHEAGNGNLFFLFDGLDEITNQELREVTAEFLTSIAIKWDKCKFVATSRPHVFVGPTILANYEKVAIAPFGLKEIKEFIQQWEKALGQTYNKASKNFDDLFANFAYNSSLRSLTKNPVMLTCMAVLHFNEKRLPSSKADLLESVTQWLIRSRHSEVLDQKESPEFVETQIRQIALAMAEEKTGIKNRIGIKKASAIISKNFNDNESNAIDFLNREALQAGLLVRRGEGDLVFWHSLFQQYLAAKEIAGKTDANSGWWSTIRNHIYDSNWREIIQLIPICLNRLGSERVDLFFKRVITNSLSKDLTVKIKTAGILSRVIRDLLIVSYRHEEITSWNKLLNSIEDIFLKPLDIDIEDKYEAAVAYGLLGDNRLIDADNLWTTIPQGNFIMGAQSLNKDEVGYDEYAQVWEGPVKEVQVEKFRIRKYPITVAEYKKFVEDSGYKNLDYWSLKGKDWIKEKSIECPGSWDNQLLTPNCPVTSISWFEAEAYCKWYSNHQEGLNSRLPTEIEWEYAAKYGLSNGKRFPWGNDMSFGNLAECNWDGSNLRKSSPVGMFPISNTSIGLSDMFGNIEEWCQDSWPSEYGYFLTGEKSETNIEKYKIVKGGSTIRVMRLCRPTYRSKSLCYNRYRTIGFRIVSSL